jgi:20S proteasome subunit beta 6
MQADFSTLVKVLQSRIRMYEHQHGKQPSTPAIAQLLSNTLYYRRFFPYYAFNVLGGVDEQGNGVAYSYDAVGSYERVQYSSSGTGEDLVQPLLDREIGWKDQKLTATKTPLTAPEVVDLVKDALTSAGERDIYTGDFVDICLVNCEGVAHQKFDLKFD